MAYNLSAFAGAGAQFFDDNGSPLAGGKLYVYAAGTTTPATTWTTQSGLVANSNPIILDAAGRTPDEIWVAGGVLYKFIVKSSTDVLIGTYDNIPGIDDPTVFNDLITVTGTNTLLGTSTPPITGYTTGATYSFVVQNTNTGAVTISIDGLGAKDVTYAGATPLIAGQLVANSIAVIEYDGTRFQLMQSSASIATVASLNVTNNATIGGNLTVTGTGFSVGGNNISAVNSLGFRNRIINGAMVIDQRNAGASVTLGSGNTYLVDRWAFYGTQASKFTAQRNAGSVSLPVGFVNYLGFTSSSAYAVLATDTFWAYQKIEGTNVADFGWGTANAQSVTLSFRVYSSITGTHSGSLANSAANRSYPFTFSVPVANTWTTISITVPGDTSGTWLADSNTGIAVNFDLGSGANYRGASGAWAAGDLHGATGAVSVVGTNGATFYITGVQLEAGTVATPFERRPYGTELALCQRYCRVYGPNTSLCTALSFSTASTSGSLMFGQTMRATPTVTPSSVTGFQTTNGAGAAIAATNVGVFSTTPDSTELQITVASGLTAGQAAVNRTATGTLTVSAEL